MGLAGRAQSSGLCGHGPLIFASWPQIEGPPTYRLPRMEQCRRMLPSASPIALSGALDLGARREPWRSRGRLMESRVTRNAGMLCTARL
jgi:hypothetical protein